MVDRVSCGSVWSSLVVRRVSSGVVEIGKSNSSGSWESVELYAEKRDARGCAVVARVLAEKWDLRGCTVAARVLAEKRDLRGEAVVARVLAEKRDLRGCAVVRGKAGSGRSEIVEVLVLLR